MISRSSLASFSRGLASSQPGCCRSIESGLSAERAARLLPTLSAQYDVSPTVVLASAVILVLSRYEAANMVSLQVCPLSDGESCAVQTVISEVIPTWRVGDLVAQVNRQLAVGSPPTSTLDVDSSIAHSPCFLRMVEASSSVPAGSQIVNHPHDSVFGVVCNSSSAGYSLQFLYRERAHAPWLVRQFGRHLAHVITRWLPDPAAPVGHLTLLDEAEAALILEHSISEEREYPLDRPLYWMFTEQAARTPEALAVVGESPHGTIERLTYRELEARINLLAGQLEAWGITLGASVGVYLERSIDSIVALLAVLRVGGVYVPLDPSYPGDYLRFILENSRVQFLVTSRTNAHSWLLPGIQTISLESCSDGACAAAAHRPAVSTADPCVIMYTSGSTGRPKGVVHCQGQIINRLHWMWETYPFQEGDVLAQRSPVTVMPSIWELLGGLLAGVPTVVIPEKAARSPHEMAAVLAEHQVSFMTLTPTVLRLLLKVQGDVATWPTRLRMVVIGGEPLKEDLYRAFREAFPLTTMVNDFGATEVNTVLHTALPPSQRGEISQNGYKSIANVSTFILDGFMRLVPFGVQGELCVAGPAVALGYLDLPDATSARFVEAVPADGAAAVRLYRTGDMGYRTPDGGIHITSRQDHQVKVNGMRVELGEVERALCLHPSVDECAVVDSLTPDGRTMLTAYVAPSTGQESETAILYNFLKDRLPPYMVPRRFEWLERLPRRPNGKLDRLALRNPAGPLVQDTARTREGENLLDHVWVRVHQIAARLLGTQSHPIDPHLEFGAIGFDSVGIVEFANCLASEFERPLSPTILFDHPTLARLTEHLASTMPSEQDGIARPAIDEQVSPLSRRVSDGESSAVAIIGMSGCFPGADDLKQFWENLCCGVESIGTVAPGRWDAESIYDPDPMCERRSYSKWGGFLSSADQFDPAFFGLSPSEARTMDPQQRLLLLESWRALTDAGYTGSCLDAQSVGVFIGARDSGYSTLIRNAGCVPDSDTLLGNDLSLLGARISYFYDLHGPSLVVDTACSSSLVALHLACRSLADGECSMALAGGVCVTNDPDFYVATSKLKVFSPTGHCRAFDEDADGFVHGEGVAFVVLKPLSSAIAECDHIYAVIRGTAVGQDGRSNGIAAPNGEAQSTLQESLYRRLGIDPDTIGYVEAHGTGTRLGDPIELQALTRTFREFTSRTRYCAIGSVKTNIGHLTAAAGITGLIKTALCLYHRTLVPSLHFDQPNPLMDLDDSPFYVSTACQSWDVGLAQVRRAALNSFGMGGTNAHCVLEEPPQLSPSGDSDKPAYLLPVTAHSEDTLISMLDELCRWVENEGGHCSLRDLSYSLLVGRRLFALGYVFVAHSVEEFHEQLLAVLKGTVPSTVRPVASPSMHSAGPLAALVHVTGLPATEYIQRLLAIAELMSPGLSIDWAPLYHGATPRRIRLPSYRFATQRYWIEGASGDEKHEMAHMKALPQLVMHAVAEVLGADPARFLSTRALTDYGLDSLRAMALKYRLERAIGRSVSLELLMEGSSADDVVRGLSATDEDRAQSTGSGYGEDFLIETFLTGELDLEVASDEQLNSLYRQLSAAVVNADAG